jgi:hypothetical protein
MQDPVPPTLDMAPDGSFRTWQDMPTAPDPGPPLRHAPPNIGWRTRLLVGGIGVSFVTGLIAVLAISFYIVLMSVPVLLALAAYGYVSARFRNE